MRARSKLATVFAGADVEATERARDYFEPYPPSSPSIAIMKDGKLVYMMERRDIEGQTADMIAARLQAAFYAALRVRPLAFGRR